MMGTPEEIRLLGEVLKKELTHKQWDKHLMCFICLFGIIIVNLLRGSRKFSSIAGIKRCSPIDWIILSTFLVMCMIVSIVAIKKVVRDQQLKIKVGFGLASTDILLTQSALLKLVIFAFIGGWVSGALGLGGGAIFNPLLLSMGVPPSVASATGMYMILFSTSGSSVIYIIYKMLNLQFGFWIGLWCSLGSLAGLIFLNKLIKRFKRQSLIVFLLVFVLGLSALLIPVFGVIDMMEKLDREEDLL